MTNDVSSEHLFAAFLDVWNDAPDEANSFYTQLLKEISKARANIKFGGLLSVGKNSAHQTQKSREPGTPTQGQLVEIYVGLLAKYLEHRSHIRILFEASSEFNYAVPNGYDFDLAIANPDADNMGTLPRYLLTKTSDPGETRGDLRRLRESYPEVEP